MTRQLKVLSQGNVLYALIAAIVLLFVFAWGWCLGSLNPIFMTKRPPRTAAVEIEKTKTDMRALILAINRFRAHYGRWPCKGNGKPDQVFGAEGQKEVIDILSGRNKEENPQGVAFWWTNPQSLSKDLFLDPWGRPYWILFDTDNDGQCTTERWGVINGSGPFMWSEGIQPITSWTNSIRYGADPK